MSKKDKIIVRNWVDLNRYVRGDKLNQNYELKFNNVLLTFVFLDLEKAVKVLNVLGGNFEYVEVEVIDTLEKWEEFQEKICRFSYVYDRVLGVFIEMRADNDDGNFVDIIDGDVTVKKIEEKYNVDLKILKEKSLNERNKI